MFVLAAFIFYVLIFIARCVLRAFDKDVNLSYFCNLALFSQTSVINIYFISKSDYAAVRLGRSNFTTLGTFNGFKFGGRFRVCLALNLPSKDTIYPGSPLNLHLKDAGFKRRVFTAFVSSLRREF